MKRKPEARHDNEKFPLADQKHKAAGSASVRLPTCSGDLTPIETVWAQLRKDLAKREFEGLKKGKVLTAAQFKVPPGPIAAV